MKGSIIINIRTRPSSRRSAIKIWVRWRERVIIVRESSKGSINIGVSVSIS